MGELQYVDRHGTASLKWDMLKSFYSREDLLSMWVADMDFRAPECVQNALKQCIDYGAYGYTSLRERFFHAFQTWQQLEHGITIEECWLRYAPGVVPALHWCVETMTQPEDSILVFTPVYYPFFNAVKDPGRRLVESPLILHGARYEMDLADVERKFSENQVKALIFCSPHNPVSRVWGKDELCALAALCKKYDVLVISDEIHQDFSFGSHTQIPFAAISERPVVTLTAPSKTFNLAGLQIAAAILPTDELQQAWDTLTKRLGMTSGNTMGYLAGEAAYLGGKAWLHEVCTQIYSNYVLLRNKLLSELPKLLIPELEGTYLMWADFGAYLIGEEIETFFEQDCALALDYGKWFHGSDTSVRFNLATSEDLVREAADRILAAWKHRV